MKNKLLALGAVFMLLLGLNSCIIAEPGYGCYRGHGYGGYGYGHVHEGGGYSYGHRGGGYYR
ncbi:MAG: hypothetical protein H0X33_07775 [Taibaiella sp.]|nr:hypothetical protein [Taibaiella sp.]